MPNNTMRGRFVWYELATSDPTAAQKFYGELAGWGTQEYNQPDGTPYTMWMKGESPIAGVWKLQPALADQGVPPHWLLYVGTEDVDKTVVEARELGAKVLVPPTDIPNMGRFAVLSDPQGAGFAVFTGLQDLPDSKFDPQIGEPSWHELTTNDHRAAWEFYSKLFGWVKHDETDMGDGTMYLMFGRSADTPMIGGMYTWNRPEHSMPPNWMIYFKVANVDERTKLIEKRKGHILNGPMDVPGNDRIAQVSDPQGAAFGIHSSAPA